MGRISLFKKKLPKIGEFLLHPIGDLPCEGDTIECDGQGTETDNQEHHKDAFDLDLGENKISFSAADCNEIRTGRQGKTSR